MRARAVGVGDRAADRHRSEALLAGGACVGLAASFKYSDGAIVIALVAAAFLSPALSFKDALKWLVLAGRISIAAVIVTNPYLFADWAHVHARPRPPAQVRRRRRRCSASPSATAGGTT